MTTVSQSSPGTGTWSTTTDKWTGTVTIRQLGPVPLRVSSISTVGNPSKASAPPSTSYLPAGMALPDGYFTHGTYPDLLTTGTGADPSLWLARGTANGKLAAPVDIGSLGNNINGGGTSDGPADWTGALVLHGDLTGDQVQDVMAYWPAQTKIASPPTRVTEWFWQASAGLMMEPQQDAWADTGPWQISDPQLCDTNLDANCPSDGQAEPSDLIAAGDLSQQGPGRQADLVGIVSYTDSTSGATTNQLDLYSTVGTPGSYGVYQKLSTTAPDGGTDWNNYVLASAELADTNGGGQQPQPDPDNIALFAINKTTGALYWSVNSDCQQGTCTTATLAGMDGWSQISTTAATTWPSAWTGSQAAVLVSADSQDSSTNGSGTGDPEIWVVTNSGKSTATATSYVVSGSYLSASLQVGTASSIAPLSAAVTSAPATNDWPLADGDPELGGTATTATDILQGNLTNSFGPSGGTCSWDQDPTFSTVLDTTGNPAQCYAPPPANALASSVSAPSISLWFKTTSHDGVLASIQGQALSKGSTTTTGYDPVLYIGNDGKLYGEWWNAHLTPTSTADPVDDGLWHHAQLVTTIRGGTTTQTLYFDGKKVGTPITGAVSLTENPANLTFGAGYIGGSWPNENYYKPGDSTGHLDYFNGEVADIMLSQ